MIANRCIWSEEPRKLGWMATENWKRWPSIRRRPNHVFWLFYAKFSYCFSAVLPHDLRVSSMITVETIIIDSCHVCPMPQGESWHLWFAIYNKIHPSVPSWRAGFRLYYVKDACTSSISTAISQLCAKNAGCWKRTDRVKKTKICLKKYETITVTVTFTLTLFFLSNVLPKLKSEKNRHHKRYVTQCCVPFNLCYQIRNIFNRWPFPSSKSIRILQNHALFGDTLHHIRWKKD